MSSLGIPTPVWSKERERGSANSFSNSSTLQTHILDSKLDLVLSVPEKDSYRPLETVLEGVSDDVEDDLRERKNETRRFEKSRTRLDGRVKGLTFSQRSGSTKEMTMVKVSQTNTEEKENEREFNEP